MVRLSFGAAILLATSLPVQIYYVLDFGFTALAQPRSRPRAPLRPPPDHQQPGLRDPMADFDLQALGGHRRRDGLRSRSWSRPGRNQRRQQGVPDEAPRPSRNGDLAQMRMQRQAQMANENERAEQRLSQQEADVALAAAQRAEQERLQRRYQRLAMEQQKRLAKEDAREGLEGHERLLAEENARESAEKAAKKGLKDPARATETKKGGRHRRKKAVERAASQRAKAQAETAAGSTQTPAPEQSEGALKADSDKPLTAEEEVKAIDEAQKEAKKRLKKKKRMDRDAKNKDKEGRPKRVAVQDIDVEGGPSMPTVKAQAGPQSGEKKDAGESKSKKPTQKKQDSKKTAASAAQTPGTDKAEVVSDTKSTETSTATTGPGGLPVLDMVPVDPTTTFHEARNSHVKNTQPPEIPMPHGLTRPDPNVEKYKPALAAARNLGVRLDADGPFDPPPIIIGAWQLLERYENEEDAVDSILMYAKYGFRWFDTADVYKDSERLLGMARLAWRDKWREQFNMTRTAMIRRRELAEASAFLEVADEAVGKRAKEEEESEGDEDDDADDDTSARAETEIYDVDYCSGY